MSKEYTLSILMLIAFLNLSFSQQFENPDLDGTLPEEGASTLPDNWQAVSGFDPRCVATPTGVYDTPDLTWLFGPDFALGVHGQAYSGSTFASGLHFELTSSLIYQEGIQQMVTGFEVDSFYTISFFQTVVKQENADDNSGVWLVYVQDETIPIVSAPSIAFHDWNDVNLPWDFRAVEFQATAETLNFMFLPFDDDSTIESTPDAEERADVRMGIDSIVISPSCEVLENLPLEIALCDEDSVILSVSSPGASYEWQDGSTDSFYLATSGYYSVKIRGADGCLSYEEVNVTYSEVINLDLGPDTVLCSSGDAIELALSLDNPEINYTWQDGSSDSTYIAAQAGLYIVTTELDGCTRSDSILVIDSVLEEFSLGPDTTLCTGDTLFINAPAFHPDVSFQWQDGTTDSQLVVTTPGIVQVIASAGHCSYSNTLEVRSIFPDFTLGDDLLICPGEIVELDASLPNTSYLWQDGSMEPIYTATSGGQYNVELIRGDCRISDTITIEEFSTMTTNLGPDTLMCPGSFLLISVPDLPDAISYLWSDQSIGHQMIAFDPGLYTVTVSLEGCTVVDSILVVEQEFQVNNWPDELFLCDDEEITLNAFQEGATYMWQDGSENASLTVSSPGSYGVQVFIDNCTGLGTIDVFASEISSFSLGNDTIVCENETLLLMPDSLLDNYLWSNGESSENISVVEAGLYWLESSEGNCTVRDSIFIDIISLPQIELGNDSTLCPGETITLGVMVDENIDIEWSNGSGETEIVVNSAGLYSVTLINGACILTDEIMISYHVNSTLSLGADTTICEDEVIQLRPSWTGSMDSELVWQDGSTNESFLADEAGSYQVTLFDDCVTLVDELILSVENCGCDVYLPSAFSPNQDGINDDFLTYTPCPITDFKMQIFDRWGGLVFESSELTKGWDGVSRGKLAVAGVYLYSLQYRDRFGNWQQEAGEIHLIR